MVIVLGTQIRFPENLVTSRGFRIIILWKIKVKVIIKVKVKD